MPTLITLVDGTIPVAADFNGNYQALNNAIGSSTAISAWSTGELPYASATNTLARLSPGTNGQVLTMGASVPGWQGGAWTTQAYNAGDYTAGGSQTWTVASGDVLNNSYLVVGKTMHWTLYVDTSSVGGTPDLDLRVAIPGSKTIAKPFIFLCRAVDNGTARLGLVIGSAAGTTVSIRKDVSGAGNWAAATDTTQVVFSAAFEIQ